MNTREMFLLGHDDTSSINIPPSEEAAKRVQGGIFPDEYYIDDAYLTAVKKQKIGNCWTYAGMAVLESFLLKHNLVPIGASDSEKIFSETHTTYKTFDIRKVQGQAMNPDGILPVDASGQLNYGGNPSSLVSYFAKKENSVLEVIDPSFTLNNNGSLPPRDNDITTNKYSDFEVKSMYLVEDPVVPGDRTFINTIKACVMTYGCVYIGFSVDFTYFKNITDDLKYKTTRSYYLPAGATRPKGGHAVAIVGWDDSFDKFTVTPSMKGAFKVKNSWGTGKHGAVDLGNGYVWISFEDSSLRTGFCITAMQKRAIAVPQTIYTHCKFGPCEYLPESTLQPKVTFSDTFTVNEDDEVLTTVGLCNVTPCKASAILKTSNGDISLFNDVYLEHPGFHRIQVPQVITLEAKGSIFEIVVIYNAVHHGAVYIPLEYSYDNQFVNLDLNTVSGSISVGDTMVTIRDYNKQNNSQYGNLPIYITTEWRSQTAKDYVAAYASLDIPKSTIDGFVGPLPSSIRPAGASSDVPIKWLPEPNQRGSYDSSYNEPFCVYKIGTTVGLMNKTNNSYDLFMTAIIGDGPYALKKRFTLTIGKRATDFEFTVSDVKNGNEVTVSGCIPELAGAKVILKCKNVANQEVVIDGNGNWKVSDWALYDPLKDGGWKDSYALSTIEAEIVDDNNLVLLAGKNKVKLKQPFTVTEDEVIIFSVMGATAIIAGIMYCYCKSKETGTEAMGYTLLSSESSIDMSSSSGSDPGAPLMQIDAGNIEGNFNGVTLTGLNGPLFQQCGNIENLTLELDAGFCQDGLVRPDKFAGLALAMKPGSTCKNCTVTGRVVGAKSVGGLFYEGENVAVEDCKVELTVTDCEEFGAIAHTISGTSTIKHVSTIVNASGKKVAGIATNLSGRLSQAAVDIKVQATDETAGICCKATHAEISNIMVTSGLHGDMAEGTKAAAVAVTMDGDSAIKNCVVVGSIEAGTSGVAYGIAGGIADRPEAIANCIVATSFISGDTVHRIADVPSLQCGAYQGIVNRKGTPFTVTNEALLSISEILSIDTFKNRGFDMDSIWKFDDKKGSISLREIGQAVYRYPFPNPYTTQDGKYVFPVNTALTISGAANPDTTKVIWEGLAPMDSISNNTQMTAPNLSGDEFSLEIPFSITKAGLYSLGIVSEHNHYKFANTIVLEIV